MDPQSDNLLANRIDSFVDNEAEAGLLKMKPVWNEFNKAGVLVKKRALSMMR